MNKNKRIKIFHIVARFEVGGMENGIVNLCNMLDREKHEITLCCLKAGGAMEKRLVDDIRVVNMGFGEGKDIFRFIRLAGFFKKEEPDIVHAHGWGQGSFDAVLAARAAKVRVIINGEHGTFFLRKMQILLQRFVAVLSDVTIAVGKTLRVETINKLGISKNKIISICNGVDTNLFSGMYDVLEVKKNIFSQYGFEFAVGDLIVGCIGSLKSIKNQIMILKTAAKLNLKSTQVKFLLVGEGNDRQLLEKFIKENNLQKIVLILGQRNDVPQLLSLIDLVVCPSIREGFSNSMLEAMASKAPVIAARSPGTEELIREGETGFIIEQNDTSRLAELIERLKENDCKLREMSIKARKFVVKNYSIEKMVKRYESLYLKMLENKRIGC